MEGSVQIRGGKPQLPTPVTYVLVHGRHGRALSAHEQGKKQRHRKQLVPRGAGGNCQGSKIDRVSMPRSASSLSTRFLGHAFLLHHLSLSLLTITTCELFDHIVVASAW